MEDVEDNLMESFLAAGGSGDELGAGFGWPGGDRERITGIGLVDGFDMDACFDCGDLLGDSETGVGVDFFAGADGDWSGRGFNAERGLDFNEDLTGEVCDIFVLEPAKDSSLMSTRSRSNWTCFCFGDTFNFGANDDRFGESCRCCSFRCGKATGEERGRRPGRSCKVFRCGLCKSCCCIFCGV